jgi:oligopeptide transport system permease protein
MSEQMKSEQEGNMSGDATSGVAEDFVITPFPGQERFVAPLDETPLKEVDTVDEDEPATSMWADAWRTLRKNPLFIISGLLIIFILIVAVFPQLFTKLDPNYCTLQNSLNPGSKGHPLGFDQQGCDIYSRVVYGTRTSVSVGILTTLIATLFGGLVGAIAGYYGRWVDALLSRVTDIFFAIPLLLGAIVVLQMFSHVVFHLEGGSRTGTLWLGLGRSYHQRFGDGNQEPRIQHGLDGFGVISYA